MKTESLHPFSECVEAKEAGFALRAVARVQGDRLVLEYHLSAKDPAFLQVLEPFVKGEPAEVPVGIRKDGLWKETCFEAFIGKSGSEGYFEFNGTVNGDWNLYSFEGYREGMKEVPVTPEATPGLSNRATSDGSLRLGFSVPLVLLGGEAAIERVGLTAVVKTSRVTTYWAIKHAGEKPDFHLRGSFCHDPVRN